MWDQEPRIKDLGTLGLGTWDPSQYLQRGPGISESLKVGPQDHNQSLKLRLPSNIEGGILIMVFLYCFTYLILYK